MTVRHKLLQNGHGFTVDLPEQPTEALPPCAACVRNGPSEKAPGASCGTLCTFHAMAFETWLVSRPRLRLELAVTAPRWTDGPRLVAIDRWMATL